MLTLSHLAAYRGPTFVRGSSFVYLPPDDRLFPYISSYTLTFPTPETMSDNYTILPSASATLTVRAGEQGIDCMLRGVNTRPLRVGHNANRLRSLLLIEFRPGGLFPFLRIPQSELLNISLPVQLLDHVLPAQLEAAFLQANSIETLLSSLNTIFLSQLLNDTADRIVGAALGDVIMSHGTVRMQTLSKYSAYSDRQLRRFFLQRVGVPPKRVAKLAQLSYALRLFDQGDACNWANIAAQAGYFDQAHMIADFRTSYGLTPGALCENLSVFYNDTLKL